MNDYVAVDERLREDVMDAKAVSDYAVAIKTKMRDGQEYGRDVCT